MPGLVYASGCFVGTEKFKGEVAAIMSLIAFGVVVCAIGEVNLVVVGVVVQLASLAFEVSGGCQGGQRPRHAVAEAQTEQVLMASNKAQGGRWVCTWMHKWETVAAPARAAQRQCVNRLTPGCNASVTCFCF